MAVQGDGTPFSSDKNGQLSQRSWAKVVDQVASAPLGREYESDSSFRDSRSYCRDCYSSNHVTSRWLHLKKDTQFVRSCSGDYEAGFEMEGDHWRQAPYPAGRQPPPRPSCQGPRDFSTIICTIAGATCDVRFATTRDQIARIRKSRLTVRPVSRLTRDLHHTVAAASQKSNDEGSCGSGFWTEQLPHQGRYCTKVRQERKEKKCKG